MMADGTEKRPWINIQGSRPLAFIVVVLCLFFSLDLAILKGGDGIGHVISLAMYIVQVLDNNMALLITGGAAVAGSAAVIRRNGAS